MGDENVKTGCSGSEYLIEWDPTKENLLKRGRGLFEIFTMTSSFKIKWPGEKGGQWWQVQAKIGGRL